MLVKTEKWVKVKSFTDLKKGDSVKILYKPDSLRPSKQKFEERCIWQVKNVLINSVLLIDYVSTTYTGDDARLDKKLGMIREEYINDLKQIRVLKKS